MSYTSKLCNDIITTPWTVTVAEHGRTLHEALFDPVTDGSAVAADSSNGQLDPAAFTDANGAAATIQRIEWAADTVKVKVSPHTELAGHKLDFIELDGSVSLSLQVDEATVDAANRTLSWTVSEQPWHDGDLLMVRIAELVTEVDLVNVPPTITQGQSASVTVRAPSHRRPLIQPLPRTRLRTPTRLRTLRRPLLHTLTPRRPPLRPRTLRHPQTRPRTRLRPPTRPHLPPHRRLTIFFTTIGRTV